MTTQFAPSNTPVVSGEGWNISLDTMTGTLAELLVVTLEEAGVSPLDIVTNLQGYEMHLFATSTTHVCCIQDFDESYGLGDDFEFEGLASPTDGHEFVFRVSLSGTAFLTELDYSAEAVRLQKESFNA